MVIKMNNIENLEKHIKEFKEKILGMDFENEEMKKLYWDIRINIDKILLLIEHLNKFKDKDKFFIRQRILHVIQILNEEINRLDIGE